MTETWLRRGHLKRVTEPLFVIINYPKAKRDIKRTRNIKYPVFNPIINGMCLLTDLFYLLLIGKLRAER